MKVTSKKYRDQAISIFGELIKFQGNVAEISEELYDKIVASKFPNIYKEGEEPRAKSVNEIDADKTIEVLKEEYLAEIDRLKNVIKAKDDKIKGLKSEVETWKKEVESLKRQIPEIQVSQKKVEPQDEASDENDLRSTLESMSFNDLKKLAAEEGMEQGKIDSSKNKKLLIDALIEYYDSQEE